jgi:hypothetical protein
MEFAFSVRSSDIDLFELLGDSITLCSTSGGQIMRSRSMLFLAILAVLMFSRIQLGAQTAPCGRTVIQMGGEKDEERFIPAPFEHAKASVIRALPAVAARPEKDEGNHLEAKIDVNLWGALKNTAFGSGGEKGNAAIGTLHIDLAAGTKDGVAGTTLKVSFSKHGLGSGRYAAPLLDETACLASLLSPNDPSANPTGSVGLASSSVPSDVALAAGKPVKVALRNYLYTGDFPKKTSTVDVVLQVIDDVQADGVVVVRRGALAKGKITDWNGPKSYGRGGSFKFVVESVTAVDGQHVPLAADAVQENGATKGEVARTVALGGLLGGLLTKGPDVLIRAGTSWEIPTSKDVVINVAR